MDDRRKRALFRATRRGFKEADILIGGFAAKELATMSDADLEVFEALLDQLDADLYAWAVGKTPTPAQFEGPVMERLKTFRAYGAPAS